MFCAEIINSVISLLESTGLDNATATAQANDLVGLLGTPADNSIVTQEQLSILQSTNALLTKDLLIQSNIINCSLLSNIYLGAKLAHSYSTYPKQLHKK